MSDARRPDHSVQELLLELFPETHRELFGEARGPARRTLGLYAVADGRLALVEGDQLAELTPLEGQGRGALHCDLCGFARSRSEAHIFRVALSPRRSRYVTLCQPTAGCQRRAGQARLAAFARRLFQERQQHA